MRHCHLAQPLRLRSPTLSTLPGKTRLGLFKQARRGYPEFHLISAIGQPWEAPHTAIDKVYHCTTLFGKCHDLPSVALLADAQERLGQASLWSNLPSLPSPVAFGALRWQLKFAKAWNLMLGRGNETTSCSARWGCPWLEAWCNLRSSDADLCPRIGHSLHNGPAFLSANIANGWRRRGSSRRLVGGRRW